MRHEKGAPSLTLQYRVKDEKARVSARQSLKIFSIGEYRYPTASLVSTREDRSRRASCFKCSCTAYARKISS